MPISTHPSDQPESKRPAQQLPMHVSADELRAFEGLPQRYTIPGWIPEGSVCLLAGAPASGKSFLALQAAIAVAAGSQAWGQAAQAPAKAFYLCADQGMQQLQGRIQTMRAALLPAQDEAVGRRLFLNFIEIPLAGSRGLPLFNRIADELPALVVIDSLVRYLPGYSDSSISATGAFFGRLRILSQMGGAKQRPSFLVLHHLNKKSGDLPDPILRVRGSSDILASVDLAWDLEREGEQHRLRELKDRLRPSRGLELRYSIRDGLVTEWEEAPAPPARLDELAAATMLRLLAEEASRAFSREELQDAAEARGVSMGVKSWALAFAALGRDKRLSVLWSGGRKMYRFNEENR